MPSYVEKALVVVDAATAEDQPKQSLNFHFCFRTAAIKDTEREMIELATLAFLELTPSLREQIRLLIPASMSREEAGSFFRHKAWSELCHAAKQAGIQPMDYASQVIELYRRDLAQNRRLPPGELLKLLG